MDGFAPVLPFTYKSLPDSCLNLNNYDKKCA